MRFSERMFGALAVAGLWLGGFQGFAAQVPDSSPGLSVGERAPGFELKDAQGVTQSLAKWLDGSYVALVFHRSADW